MLKSISFLIGFIGVCATNSWSQTETSTPLTLDEFYALVNDHHPLAKQATLLNNRGELTVKQARGSFDPKLISDYERKNFNGKNYYDLWDSYVKIPTLLNIDLKAGYEQNQGTYLNQENTVPDDGLYYAGVSVPLGQGLIHNQRNVGLKKSKFENQAFENEANNVLNNLFLDANYAYWLWYEKTKKQEVIKNNVAVVRQKYEGIRQAVYNGDKAAIDSIEMLIQVQLCSNQLIQAELGLQNSRLLLNNFLWNDSTVASAHMPTAPSTINSEDFELHIDWALANHPQLKKLNIESEIIDLDKKLASESLKPIFDINYNLLLAGQENLTNTYFSNNYKFGFDFSFPLLIRKERAKLKIVKIKQQEYDLKIDQKNRAVINKITQSHNKVFALREMLAQQERIQENYQQMLRAEQIKFNNGESSVFLLNSRENKKLQGEIKLITLRAKYHRSIGELKWSTGKLHHDITTPAK